MEDAEQNKHFEFLIIAILSLVALLIFFVFLGKMNDIFQEKAYDDVCNQYIKMNMLANKALLDANSQNFPCKTQYLTVTSKLKYDIMKNVSDSLVRCYNSFYRGNENLFSAESGKFTRFCTACYHINFTEHNIKITNEELLSFQGLKAGSNEKYADVLAQGLKGVDVSEFEDFTKDSEAKKLIRDNLNAVVIDTSKDYAIVFVYDKKEAPTLLEKVLKGAVAGATVVVVGTAVVVSGGTALTFIVPLASVGAISGGTITYAVYKKSNNGASWVAQIKAVPMEANALGDLKCDKILGIQEPGITNSGVS
jgi:hypothetical protein